MAINEQWIEIPDHHLLSYEGISFAKSLQEKLRQEPVLGALVVLYQPSSVCETGSGVVKNLLRSEIEERLVFWQECLKQIVESKHRWVYLARGDCFGLWWELAL